MSITGLELLTEWLLAEGHQCVATDLDGPCWCQEEETRQRQETVGEGTERSQDRHSVREQQAPTLLGRRVVPQGPTSEIQKHQNRGSSDLVEAQQNKQPESDTALSNGQRQPKHPVGQQHHQYKLLQNSSANRSEGEESELKPDYFLSLPTEIRTRVYRYLFPRKFYHWYWHSRSLAAEHRTWSAFLCPFKYPTALLETCKTIHQEATAELYNRVVVVCDLRPDRFSGFHLISVKRSVPRLEMITRIVINLQLDIVHFNSSHQSVIHQIAMPDKASYWQLRFLRCLTRLGLRVVADSHARLAQKDPGYESILRLHVKEILTAVGDRVVVEGVGNWEPLWRANEVCSSLEGELRELAASKSWVSTVIASAQREIFNEKKKTVGRHPWRAVSSPSRS